MKIKEFSGSSSMLFLYNSNSQEECSKLMNQSRQTSVHRTAASLIRPVDSVRDLDVLIDSGLTLSDHVNKVAALCYFHIRQLRIVRRTLTDEVAHSLV